MELTQIRYVMSFLKIDKKNVYALQQLYFKHRNYIRSRPKGNDFIIKLNYKSK